MKKIFFLILTFFSIFILISCDYRKPLSEKKCNELYNYIIEQCNLKNVNEYLYHDYYEEFLLIKKGEELYCSKNLAFFENYDYSIYFDHIQFISHNYKPLFITGYKIDTQVEYFLNIKYDFLKIKEDIGLSINNYNLSLYKNQNIGIELMINNDDVSTYSIEIIVGNIDLSKYNQFNLKKLIFE